MSETKGDGTNEGALWGARFATGPSPELVALSRSTHFDWDLALYDIAGSHAHAKALAAAGYLTADEAARDARRSRRPRARASPTALWWPSPDDEDVHGALERRSSPTVGAGARRQAARRAQPQRPDRDARADVPARPLAHDRARDPRASSTLSSRRPKRTPPRSCPGARTCSTRSRCCSPTTCRRTPGRSCAISSASATGRRAHRVSPYGGGALAGSTLGLDPQLVARELGLARPAENSLDGTSARDVVAEFAFITAMIGVDLSRFAEEIILWNTREFGFVTLDDGYSTGSSIMPQKKNPDIAELARGKAGRLIGNLTGLLATLKGLPLAYNRDLQEDKEPVFDSVRTLEVVLPAFAGMVATLRFDTERMARARAAGLLARDRCRRVAGQARRPVPRRARDLRRPRASCARSAGSSCTRRATTMLVVRVAAPHERRPRGAQRRGLGREPRRRGRNGAGAGRRAADRADHPGSGRGARAGPLSDPRIDREDRQFAYTFMK